MSKNIKLGTKDICKSCGEPIEFLKTQDTYWSHINSSPRHIAEPTNHNDKKVESEK